MGILQPLTMARKDNLDFECGGYEFRTVSITLVSLTPSTILKSLHLAKTSILEDRYSSTLLSG